MPRRPMTPGDPKRKNQPLTVMLTQAQLDAVQRYAGDLQVSMSAAGRIILDAGIKALGLDKGPHSSQE